MRQNLTGIQNTQHVSAAVVRAIKVNTDAPTREAMRPRHDRHRDARRDNRGRTRTPEQEGTLAACLLAVTLAGWLAMPTDPALLAEPVTW